MSEPARRPPATVRVHGVVHRLESWKEIAAYLGHSVRTVQRWEARAGLPVYRLSGLGSVHATPFELDAWCNDHRNRLEHDEPAAPAERRASTNMPAVARGALAVAALGLVFGLVLGTHSWRSASRLVDPGVHEAYLKGRLFLENPTEEQTRKAIDSFEQAVRDDPGHAPAYAGLARAHLASANLLVSTRDAIAPARAAAQKAMSLDASSAEAYTAKGLLRAALDWDPRAAERDLRQAVQIDPTDARAHLYLGIALILQGRNEEGITLMERSRQLDPVSVKINARLGMIYAFLGRRDEGLVQCRKALELDKNSPEGHMCVGFVLERGGAYAEAACAYEKAGELGYRAAPHAARVLALSGQVVEARRRLGSLEEGHRQGEAWSPYDLAKVSHALGDEEGAFMWLEVAYDERDETLVALRVEPEWDDLRSDPRFVAIARKTGATPER